MIWIVDPLDGTSDFIDKTGEFTVMIALIQIKNQFLELLHGQQKKHYLLHKKIVVLLDIQMKNGIKYQ